MTFASLGPSAAADVLSYLLATSGDATVALTQHSANPAGSPVELALSSEFYARQPITWGGSAGLWSNNETAAWADLPEGTTVGGFAVLNATYGTLASPLAWVDLTLPISAVSGIALIIPAHSIIVQSFTTPS